MELASKGLLSGCESLLPPLSLDSEGHLRGGFCGMAGGNDRTYENQRCSNVPCRNNVCLNIPCKNQECHDAECKNKCVNGPCFNGPTSQQPANEKTELCGLL
jgi:hypothetical protein